MGVEIPDALKQDVPKTIWGKVLASTPVVMTVIATLLAGLSNSEMTRAQYVRSLAAQQQSKAADQWGFFQAKRLRGTGLRTTADLLLATAEVGQLDAAGLSAAVAALGPAAVRVDAGAKRLLEALAAPGTLDSAVVAALRASLESYLETAPERAAEATQGAAAAAALATDAGAAAALAAVCAGDLPAVDPAAGTAPSITAALAAVADGRPEPEVEPLMAEVQESVLAEAMRAARDQTRGFDAKTGPFTRVSDRLDRLLGRQAALAQASRAATRLAGTVPAAADPRLRQTVEAFVAAGTAAAGQATQTYRDFTAARLRFSAARYDAEARMNQGIANLLELQVRKSNLEAQRHHVRSQRFFYGMLAAQAAVIIATFAMAARQRNLLWGLAAGAGAAAVSFAVYVYLFV